MYTSEEKKTMFKKVKMFLKIYKIALVVAEIQPF